MDASYFVRGLAIGFAIAAPVGPVGLLCIRRTLAEGRVAGFVSGLGAATADACYGAVAALGLTVVSSFLVAHLDLVRLLGGAFLCYLGWRTATASPAREATLSGASRLGTAYGSTFVLTLTNPATILSFAAVFAGLGLGAAVGDRAAAMQMVGGVLLGSAFWWLLLSGAVGLFRLALTPARLRWINRLSGALLTAFGLLALLSLRS